MSGPTGSGKSTLCDVIPWILFGRTSKGGSVDEVLTWPGDDKTSGALTLEISGKLFQVQRSRNPNDLILWEDGEAYRGKDLNDTQKIINDKLGLTLELYLSGAYFNEFSQTAQFFTSTAKQRRQLTEQLVDLTLAKRIVEVTADYKKMLKIEIVNLNNNLTSTCATLASLDKIIEADKQMSQKWEENQIKKIEELKIKSIHYKTIEAKRLTRVIKEHDKTQKELEEELADIEKSITPDIDLKFLRASLDEEKKKHGLLKDRKCPTCGGKFGEDKSLILLKRDYELTQKELDNDNKKKLINLKLRELSRHGETKSHISDEVKSADNLYAKQLDMLKVEKNPFITNIDTRIAQQLTLKEKITELKNAINDYALECNDSELLLDVADSFRSLLIKNTVVDIETNTNKILNEYFDSEVQVKFELKESDKLETILQKDGNVCSFTQLSKGQRQLLKLAFSVAVMRCVSNHNNVSFNALFFDEALDGLDDVLKLKSYDLLQKLALDVESVFVVEHNEALKSMFPNRFDVSLTSEGSILAET